MNLFLIYILCVIIAHYLNISIQKISINLICVKGGNIMSVRKSAGEITKRIKERIYQGEFMERHRTSAKHFTRKRKLPFASLILFMLNLIKRTLQNELTQFIQKFSTKYENKTKSAFSQSRLKLKPEVLVLTCFG